MLSAVLYYWTACRLYHTPLLSPTLRSLQTLPGFRYLGHLECSLAQGLPDVFSQGQGEKHFRLLGS